MTNAITPAAGETRARLLAVATVIFSEFGYRGATTRMICDRAHANPAAVNYHFGDKLGLYTEVLTSVMRKDQAHIGEPRLLQMEPETALREFITRLFNSMINFDTQDPHVRLMAHELSQPTPALAAVVEQIIQPRALLLCEIVSRIIGNPPQSLQTRLAVHSIIAQVVHYMHAQPMIKLLWPHWKLDAKARSLIIDHIADFSLQGLRSVRPSSNAKSTTSKPKPRIAR